VKKAVTTPLGITAIIVLGGLLVNAVAPVRPSQTQAVFGGADDSAGLVNETLAAQDATLQAANPLLSGEIDYDAADALLFSSATLSGNATGAGTGPARSEVITYVVEEGDNLSAIASRFNITLTTLLNSNPNIKPSALAIGQKLTILPVDGVVHTVKKGETVGALAIRYGVTPSVITNANEIKENIIATGDALIIPGGKATIGGSSGSSAARSVASSLTGYIARVSNSAVYPLGSRGRQTAGQHGRYGAYDLAAPTGTSIVAVENGIVEYAKRGWEGGYGNRVIIRHDNGRQTLYAHMSTIDVSTGQYVSRGQRLGGVGSTGNSTGPHLHFEVR